MTAPYYEHGGVTIYHGDCREILPTISADVMVSDPPYGMSYQSGWKEGSSVANDNSVDARDDALGLWGERPAIVFGRWSAPRPSGVRIVLIWDKGDWPGMGDLSCPWGPSTEEIYVIGSGFVGRRSGQIVRDPRRPTGATALHPTQKPIGLMELLLQKVPQQWVVCDPFMGSGTTLVASKNLGRRAIGIELEERYCEIAAMRLAQGTLFSSDKESA